MSCFVAQALHEIGFDTVEAREWYLAQTPFIRAHIRADASKDALGPGNKSKRVRRLARLLGVRMRCARDIMHFVQEHNKKHEKELASC